MWLGWLPERISKIKNEKEEFHGSYFVLKKPNFLQEWMRFVNSQDNTPTKYMSCVTNMFVENSLGVIHLWRPHYHFFDHPSPTPTICKNVHPSKLARKTIHSSKLPRRKACEVFRKMLNSQSSAFK